MGYGSLTREQEARSFPVPVPVPVVPVPVPAPASVAGVYILLNLGSAMHRSPDRHGWTDQSGQPQASLSGISGGCGHLRFFPKPVRRPQEGSKKAPRALKAPRLGRCLNQQPRLAVRKDGPAFHRHMFSISLPEAPFSLRYSLPFDCHPRHGHIFSIHTYT